MRVRTDHFSTDAPLALHAFEERFSLRLARSERTFQGSRVWTGRVEGEPFSNVLLCVHGSATVGDVVIPGKGQYQIRPIGGGRHVLREVDTAQLPPLSDPIDPATGEPIPRVEVSTREAAR